MTLHPYWHPLDEAFTQLADPAVAAGAAAYMKHISVFYGIKAPERRLALGHFLKENSTPDINKLEEISLSAWMHPQREMQYAAMEVLFKVRKKTTAGHIHLLEKLIVTKSWWDTIDYIAPHLVSSHFERYPEQRDTVVTRWMESGNIWLQRSCLLFQLKAKKHTDSQLLFSLIEQLSDHKEFFIRKAIGWVLREYAKTNPGAVIEFVETHDLSGLSRREALKHLEK